MFTSLRKTKAFSLIELSIVVLIIGILIAGVTQGSRLVRISKLKTAQNQTNSSPVSSINNLIGWWEATSDPSFKDSEEEDGLSVTVWNDISPQLNNKNNATGTATYIASAINGLPSLRFNGSTNYLIFDGSSLIGSSYTIFVVEQRRSNKAPNYFLCGTDVTSNANLHVGYSSNTTLAFRQYANDYDIATTGYSTPSPKIHTLWFNQQSGKNYYLNGVSQTLNPVSIPAPVSTQGLLAYNNSAIGCSATSGTLGVEAAQFNGDIAEVIIYSKALKTEERKSIESYLGKKWGISVS